MIRTKFDALRYYIKQAERDGTDVTEGFWRIVGYTDCLIDHKTEYSKGRRGR